MTFVYDMTGGDARSDEPQNEHDVDRQETGQHPAGVTPRPELQVVETTLTPRDDSIHLLRGLLEKFQSGI